MRCGQDYRRHAHNFESETPYGEFEEESRFDEMEDEYDSEGPYEFEDEYGDRESDNEYETEQKNWYYFDAWWRASDGSIKRLEKHGPWKAGSDEASRVFDLFCLNQQNAAGGRSNGKLLVRCYQWLPESSRWIECKSVVGFKRGACTAPDSELGESWEMEAPRAPVAPPKLRFVKNLSGTAAECTAALTRAGKTRAEALTIIDTQVANAITMLRNAAAALKRGSRSEATRKLFLEIFRVAPESAPSWLKPTASIKDRGDVVAVRCLRVADLLESGTLKFFCTVTTANCPDCADPCGWACSSWGDESVAPKRPNVICLGCLFWDAMNAGDTDGVLSTVMHEPFHIYFGKVVTSHPGRGKFGGIACIIQFVFEVNGRTPHRTDKKDCDDTAVKI